MIRKLLLILAFLIFCTPAYSTTVTLQEGLDGYSGTIDTSIHYSNESTTNYGTGTSVGLQTSSGNSWIQRGLFKFDLSSIPSGSTINSAVFSGYMYADSGSTFTAGVYRLLRAWTENGATGDTYDGSNNWGTQGANNTSSDRSATSSGDFSYPSWELPGFKAFTITTAVQNWVNGTWDNNGFCIVVSAGTIADGNGFYSSEYTTDTAKRPKLVIDYTAPSGTSTNNLIIKNAIISHAILP